MGKNATITKAAENVGKVCGGCCAVLKQILLSTQIFSQKISVVCLMLSFLPF